MAIVTTYVCDITGKQGVDENDFFSIQIITTPAGKGAYYKQHITTKLVHKEVAERLHLVIVKDNPNPAPTFESQLTTVLKTYIDDLVYDSVADATANRN